MNKTAWLTGIGLLIFVAGGLYYFLRDEPLIIETPPVVEETSSLLTFTGTSYIEEENGKKLWELTAENIEVDNTNKKAYLHNIKASFYQDNGARIDLTGQEGLVYTDIKDILLTGDVKAVSTVDGGTFTAPQALWHGKERSFFANGGITVTKKDTVITGDQIETDAGMEKVKVTGHAKVVKGGNGENE